jgi:hypothetical protein
MLLEVGLLYVFRILTEFKGSRNSKRRKDEEDIFYDGWVNLNFNSESLCL